MRYQKPFYPKSTIVKHNGHTFKSVDSYRRTYADVNKCVTFVCTVCGLKANAERHDTGCAIPIWREWSGEGSEVHCGIVVAMEVMDS